MMNHSSMTLVLFSREMTKYYTHYVAHDCTVALRRWDTTWRRKKKYQAKCHMRREKEREWATIQQTRKNEKMSVTRELSCKYSTLTTTSSFRQQDWLLLSCALASLFLSLSLCLDSALATVKSVCFFNSIFHLAFFSSLSPSLCTRDDRVPCDPWFLETESETFFLPS